MLRKLSLAALVVLALPLATTQAGGVRIGVGIGVPYGGYYGGGYYGGPYYGGYYGGPYYGYPYYYRPVYVAPPPVIVQPAPVYAQPAADGRLFAARTVPNLLRPALPGPQLPAAFGPAELLAAVQLGSATASTAAINQRSGIADLRKSQADVHRRLGENRRLQKLVVNPREFAFPSWQNCL